MIQFSLSRTMHTKNPTEILSTLVWRGNSFVDPQPSCATLQQKRLNLFKWKWLHFPPRFATTAPESTPAERCEPCSKEDKMINITAHKDTEDTTTATKPLCHCWVTTRYCCRKTASTTNGTNVTWIVVDPRVDPVRKKAIFIIGKSPEIIGRRPLLKLNLVTVTSSPRDGPAGVNRIMTKQSAPCVRDLNNKSIPSWADI